MKERPILFSAPMVRALLAGTKTQMRRVVKPQPTDGGLEWVTACGGDFAAWQDPLLLLDEHSEDGGPCQRKCPYGRIGEKLWVRESFARIDGQTRPWIETDYRATYKHGDRLGDTLGITKRWTPSIYMPRHASRITLEVTDVRVERLGDVSESDARAEGVQSVAEFKELWASINGPGSWDANPWVWVVEFKRVKGGAA